MRFHLRASLVSTPTRHLLSRAFSSSSKFNSLIKSNFRNPVTTISVYSQMLSFSILPDHVTFPLLFKSLHHHHNHYPLLSTAQSLHSHVVILGFDVDTYVQNSLIAAYSSSVRIDLARKVFDEMTHRDLVSDNSMLAGYLRCREMDAAMVFFSGMRRRNARSWNSIISSFVKDGRCREAIGLFQEMMVGGSVNPDGVTVASVVSGCANVGALDQGKWVHGYLGREGLEVDMVLGTALVDMYGKCGCVRRAVEAFRDMGERDVVAWTTMISTLAINGLGEDAFVVFQEMERHGMRPNHVTFGALLSACAHSGLVEKGRWCFDAMKRVYSIEPQLQHYACMVDLLGRSGLFEEAEQLIECMPMEPDSFVWGALLGACRMHGNVDLGERVAGYLIASNPQNHAYYIILSDLYANAKRYGVVKRIRDFMKDQGIKKSPGCSLIEVHGQVHQFTVKGMSKEITKELEWVLNGINGELKGTDCVLDDIMGLFMPLKNYWDI